MSREEIFTRLKTIAAAVMTLPATGIREDMSVLQDLGLDSISIADLSIRVESEFGFEFAEADLQAMNTVGDLLDIIERSHKS